MRISNLCLIFIISFLYSTTSIAKEIIETYHSDIQVFESGEMLVKETIVAVAERNQIKRGIYRDFPLNYKDHFGNRYRVDFDIVGIKRNGTNESYHTKSTKAGIRIYIGKKNVILDKGKHIFEITYKTNRQLGFFEEYDELYWNVTGNDWAFPINRASASVILPNDIGTSEISLTGFTGKYRSREKNFISNVKSSGESYFETTKPLNIRDGLTIVVNWPKGFVREPTWLERFTYVLRDNLGVCIGVIGLAIILIYYLVIWSKVGRDPEQGVIFPEYEPPGGYSPASMRFIKNMRYDNTCFTAAIVNLAVKGYLSISDDSDSVYTLAKEKTGTKPMAPGEKTLLNKLFGSRSSITLKNSNHAKISSAIDAHEKSLENNYEKIYFITNSGYFVLGVFITFLVMAASLLVQINLHTSSPIFFMFVWLSLWSLAVGALLNNAWVSWKHVSSFSQFMTAISNTVIFSVFMFFEITVFIMLAKEIGWSIPILIIKATLINIVFYELLKAPTKAGRILLDKVEGFKNYIDIAEKHDLEYKYSGGKTPELFERILPYAIALNIEQQWASQFESELKNAVRDQNYSPTWYHGSNFSTRDLTGFSSSLGGSLSSAISSAATAPGSSSGSGGFSGGGGGGFSGGGGGGGGGGGW